MSANRLNDVLRAAERRFVKHGPAKTTLDEIARDLRLSKSAIYHYFSSKEELYSAVLKKQAADYIRAVVEIFNNEERKFQERFRSYFTLKTELKSGFKLLYGLLLADVSERSLSEEKEILKKLFIEEETVIKLVFTAYFKDSLNAPKEDAAMLFVSQTSMLPFIDELFAGTLELSDASVRNKLFDQYEQMLNGLVNY
ncbi:MAG: hypothetical protein HBSAPP04_17670 [Ignavibacteriaceae bacterium]|nr:MAG: hypothetical protein HBSAPP04_17670 [Ignavibacteriaceae bacterium]